MRHTPFALLRARRNRPRGCCAAEERDELPALHSITSSASHCIELGTASPSALVVLILMTSSNLVVRSTGRSAGLLPLRIRPPGEKHPECHCRN
jgi:hypothetical protein